MAVEIKLSGPVVGLDIGSKLIKVAEARATKDGIQLTGIGVMPTPEDLYISGTVIDAKALGQAIKAFLAERKIQAKKVVSSVSGQSSVVVRIIEVPMMSDQELKETMKWEVERHVPFAANEVEQDFVPIPSLNGAPDAQTMEVLLVVAQREAINAHVEVLQAAGLQPEAIDVGPLAAARTLIDASDPALQDQTVVIVNIGSTTTDIGIFRKGTLSFTRPMPIAGDTFTKAIADALTIPTEEAEELKKQQGAVLLEQLQSALSAGVPTSAAPAFDLGATQIGGLPTEDEVPEIVRPDDDESPVTPVFDLSADADDGAEQVFDLQAPFVYPSAEEPQADASAEEPVAELPQTASPELTPEEISTRERVFAALLPVLTDFVTELRRSLDYFRSRSNNEPIARIFLCGGGAQLTNLDAYLSGELGIPVDIAGLGSRIQPTYNGYSAEELQQMLPVMPIAIGLAIRDMVYEVPETAPKPVKAGTAA